MLTLSMVLHRVKWKIDDKLSSIFDSYVRYIKRHYDGDNIIVAFDGYEMGTTNNQNDEL